MIGLYTNVSAKSNPQRPKAVFIPQRRPDLSFSGVRFCILNSRSTVYLSGDLVRSNGEFTAREIENIARELAALSHVRSLQFALNNWIVDMSGDSWQVHRVRKTAGPKGTAGQTGVSDDTIFVIEREEDLQDIINDIEDTLKRKD